jgi:hypothetical protein
VPRGLTKVHTASTRVPRSAVTTRRTESGRATLRSCAGTSPGGATSPRRAGGGPTGRAETTVTTASTPPGASPRATESAGRGRYDVPSMVKTSSPATAS